MRVDSGGGDKWVNGSSPQSLSNMGIITRREGSQLAGQVATFAKNVGSGEWTLN